MSGRDHDPRVPLSGIQKEGVAMIHKDEEDFLVQCLNAADLTNLIQDRSPHRVVRTGAYCDIFTAKSCGRAGHFALEKLRPVIYTRTLPALRKFPRGSSTEPMFRVVCNMRIFWSSVVPVSSTTRRAWLALGRRTALSAFVITVLVRGDHRAYDHRVRSEEDSPERQAQALARS